MVASKIYIAGPLGFSELARTGQQRLCDLVASLGHEPVDPFALTDAKEIERIASLPTLESQRDAWRELNMKIGATNRSAIDACDLVLAVLDGADVDSGTAAEIGYAFAVGKRILGYRGDVRLSADNSGGIVNLQVEYFIRASGGDVFSSLDKLQGCLNRAQR